MSALLLSEFNKRHLKMKTQEADQESRSLLYIAADNTNATDALVSALHQYGYETKCFHSAEELNKAIATQEPHALILDCDAANGQLAEAAMKARGEGEEVFFPVIMLSSEDVFEKRLAAVRANVEGYFIKPVDITALCDRIDDKISRRKIRAFRILAVDDDVLLSEFYQAVLSLAAMQVKVVNDPTQILDALHSFKPDLILMDMYMPTCSGAELAKLIRQNNTYVDIPLIFLSGDGDIDRQVSAIETGADNFLTKPIDPENLISIITSRVERYRALRRGSGG
jgi:DNA-binding response OmpR family regulator